MAITTNVSNDYLAQYNISLGVSATLKSGGFAYLQRLAYNAMLEPLKENFLSLNDWSDQIKAYSAAVTALTPALAAITPLIPLNLEMTKNIVDIDSLGLVGKLLESVPGYNTIFSLSNNELTNPNAISTKALGV